VTGINKEYMVKHLIQIDGIIKEYKPEELPDGCVVTSITPYDDCIVPFITYLGKGVPLTYKHIKIHDIIKPETGESTHERRWMATDKKSGWVGVYYRKPKRNMTLPLWEGLNDGHNYTTYKGHDNFCGQTWEDEPRPVWIEIPKE
jgi:hypothetical protein